MGWDADWLAAYAGTLAALVAIAGLSRELTARSRLAHLAELLRTEAESADATDTDKATLRVLHRRVVARIVALQHTPSTKVVKYVVLMGYILPFIAFLGMTIESEGQGWNIPFVFLLLLFLLAVMDAVDGALRVVLERRRHVDNYLAGRELTPWFIRRGAGLIRDDPRTFARHDAWAARLSWANYASVVALTACWLTLGAFLIGAWAATGWNPAWSQGLKPGPWSLWASVAVIGLTGSAWESFMRRIRNGHTLWTDILGQFEHIGRILDRRWPPRPPGD